MFLWRLLWSIGLILVKGREFTCFTSEEKNILQKQDVFR